MFPHDAMMRSLWKGRAAVALVVMLATLGASEFQVADPEGSVGSDRKQNYLPDVIRQLRQPLKNLFRYQRSQMQDYADYGRSIPSEPPATYPLDNVLFAYNLNRRKINQNAKQKMEMRQRDLAKLEASELRKNPAKFAVKLGEFLNHLQNIAASQPRLRNKFEAISAKSKQLSPTLNEPGIEPAATNDDFAPPQGSSPDGKTEEGEEPGTDDGSELRRSLCHFKLCPLWRKPWQDN